MPINTVPNNVVTLASFENAIRNAHADQRFKLNESKDGLVSGTPVMGKLVTFFKQQGANLGIGSAKSSLKEHKYNNYEVREQFLQAVKIHASANAIAPSRFNGILTFSDEPLTKLEIEQALNKAEAIVTWEESGVSYDAVKRIGLLRAQSGGVKELASGKVNTVYQGDFGTIKNGVFKPSIVDANNPPEPASEIRIPPSKPNFTGRSVAAAVVSQLLESTLVGKTEFAEHNGKHGFVTEFAKGKSPQNENPLKITNPNTIEQYESLDKENRISSLKANNHTQIGKDYFKIEHTYDNIDYTEPKLAARLTELHLFDELTGQVDRHQGNVFIELDNKTKEFKSLTAIDNDFSFGRQAITKDANSKLPESLPSIVPKSVAEKFLSLDEATLRKELTGLLDKVEIDATVDRLGTIQSYLRDIKDTPSTIEDDKWESKVITENCIETNSYIGRFEANALKANKHP